MSKNHTQRVKALLQNWLAPVGTVHIDYPVSGQTSEADAMQTKEKISIIYEEWERRVREDAERVGEQRGELRGEQRGKEDGQREGQRALLLAQLGQRFGPLPADARARLEAASAEELERMGLRVLTAQSLAEVLAPQER